MDDISLYSVIGGIIFGYLMGSCPSGYLLVRYLKGEDIRKFGSGNIGATNVARVLGKKWAVVVAIADMSKGGLAILIAMLFGAESPLLLSLIGFAGVVGHDNPVWIGFKGGKGVATTFGVFACYGFFNPIPAIIGGIVWFLVREVSGYVSLASMVSIGVAVVLMPVFMMDRFYYISGLFLLLLTVWRHRENIARLMAGCENKANRFFLKK